LKYITYMHTYIYGDSIMKPTKYCLKKGEERGRFRYNRRGKFDQSTL
jgi:hypothetical protein